MDELKLTVARNIAELRRAAGLTQSELAEKLHYTDKAVSKWERGDSIPDLAVLKALAETFGVSLDYLTEAEHSGKSPVAAHRRRNRMLITGMSVLLVWLLATLAYVAVDIVVGGAREQWLAFVAAVPVSCIVWLVFNSVWFRPHRNYLIISLLMWSLLALIFAVLCICGVSAWQVFLLGLPGQCIILFWSGIRFGKKKEKQ